MVNDSAATIQLLAARTKYSSTTRSIRTAFSVHFCVLSLVNNDWVRRAD